MARTNAVCPYLLVAYNNRDIGRRFKVGYFDDKRFPFGLWEDVDLVRRIRHAGFEVVVDAQTFIEHGGPYGQSNSILQRPFTATLRFIDNGLRFGKNGNNFLAK